MANKHSTLTGLFSAIADAIRAKTGGSASIVADNFPAEIAAIDTQENLDAEMAAQDNIISRIATAVEGKSGVTLPTLSNPATADKIANGYEAIDGSGNKVTGTGVFAEMGSVDVVGEGIGKSATITQLINANSFILIFNGDKALTSQQLAMAYYSNGTLKYYVVGSNGLIYYSDGIFTASTGNISFPSAYVQSKNHIYAKK